MSEIKFNSGQSVQPAYEGWTRNPDGSRSMWFGYMNRNWEETPDIPAGANNGFGAASRRSRAAHALPSAPAGVRLQSERAGGLAGRQGSRLDGDGERHDAEGVRLAVAGLGDRRTDHVGEQRRPHRENVRRAREPAADDVRDAGAISGRRPAADARAAGEG